MSLQDWLSRSEVHPGAPGMRSLTVPYKQWQEVAAHLAGAGARLISLWASGQTHTAPLIHAAFLIEGAGLILTLPLKDSEETYPGIEHLFPSAARMQRAVADLYGLRSTDPDTRPWLRHAAWPPNYRPLIDPCIAATATEARIDCYDFVRVAGDGVHEIAVGPVHAGTIEPGHFRFSVVGEKVLRLEEHLGYVHKGIEQRFQQLPILEAHRLAARVSGDSTVAYSWAYCQALEGLTDTEVPPRGTWLRALYLELERTANHLGDLGALGYDAGVAFGVAQFSRLKEQLLRVNQAAFGERYLMNAIVPGGTRDDLGQTGLAALRECVWEILGEVRTLRTIYE